MESQKIENLLNLSLLATPNELSESEELSAGYDETMHLWELIFKYHGDILQYETDSIMLELLSAGYGIVRLPESSIELFSNLPEVEYIEKAKPLFFSGSILDL